MKNKKRKRILMNVEITPTERKKYKSVCKKEGVFLSKPLRDKINEVILTKAI